MVENSNGLHERMSGWFSLHSAYLIVCFIHSFPTPLALGFAEPPLPCRGSFLASRALGRLSMRSVAGDSKGLPLQSIVGWFSLLPWLASAGDSVVPDACHLALRALRMPLVAIRVDARSDSRLATTPDGRASVGAAAPSPRCDVPARLFHGGPSDSPVQ
jgi:hypothetical protein